MDGKATLTMVASRKARKAPKQATSSTRDAGTRPRRAAATDHLLGAASVPRGSLSPPDVCGGKRFSIFGPVWRETGRNRPKRVDPWGFCAGTAVGVPHSG